MDESQLLLSVTGMTCSACVASVERVLSNVDGVVSVSVNLPLEKATVSLSDATVDARQAACIAAVEAAGFGASAPVPALRQRQQNEESVTAQGRRVAVAFGLALPVFILSMFVKFVKLYCQGCPCCLHMLVVPCQVPGVVCTQAQDQDQVQAQA